MDVYVWKLMSLGAIAVECALQINLCMYVWVNVCLCACVHACFGSVPHCLRLTGCPCRVNKTNLCSGLAREGGDVYKSGVHIRGGGHTRTHTHTQILKCLPSHLYTYTLTVHTSLVARPYSSPGKTPINTTSSFGKGLLTHTHIQLESKSI